MFNHYKLVCITEGHQQSHYSQGPLQCTSHMQGGSGIFTIIQLVPGFKGAFLQALKQVQNGQ